jgi:hypothetical protein
MDSIDPNADLELIAAFIDGKLAGEDRARVVKLLAESDEALEVFATALAEQHANRVSVVPITRARRWRQWRVIVPVAAAAGLATLFVPKLVGRGASPVLANEYATELERGPRFATGLPSGWEQRGWSVTRGAPSPDVGGRPNSAAESRLAFRLGVRSIDLQVALRRGDTALAGRLTDEVLETLKSVGFSEAAAASYAELRSKLATELVGRSLERASGAERQLRDLLRSPSFSFGEWVGAADLAARSRDAAFFDSPHGTRFVRSSIPAGGLAADDSAALGSIEARLRQGRDERALDEVHEVLQTIIRRRAG